MNRYMINIITITTAVLFSACGEQDKKAVAEATAKSVAFNEKRSTEVTDVTKQTATKLAKEASKAATDAVQTVKESTEETLQAAKEELSKVVVAQAPGDRGEELYVKCAGCHGSDGSRHALNKSALLAGQSASDLANKLKAYQAGERNVSGMGNLMKEQLAGLQKSDILALAEYISTFTKKGTE